VQADICRTTIRRGINIHPVPGVLRDKRRAVQVWESWKPFANPNDIYMVVPKPSVP
jgi:hypothetical protein